MGRTKKSTLVARARKSVPGFDSMYKKLEQKVKLSGLSPSTLLNYGRSIAKIALFFGKPPLELEDDTINEYLLELKAGEQPSESYFKHTVYGLRYLFRLFGREDRAIKLPPLRRQNQLPVVLSRAECKRLFTAPKLLKHRVMLTLTYSAGLRLSELVALCLEDIDSDRMQIRIRQSKGNKDRYVILSSFILQGLRKYFQAFAKDPKHLGARTGMTAILHTWGQQLALHPHIHCIVPGGGLTTKGQWKNARAKGKYLFPSKALSKVFRAKFVHALRQWADCQGIHLPATLFKQLFSKPWVVYAKRPFLGPGQVIEYLGRYTHKIAISNHRLLAVDDRQITFSFKDYRQEARKKSMTLGVQEFIRRFALHVLPPGFVRIRHYGILASRNKAHCLELARCHLNVPNRPKVQISWRRICAQRLGFQPDQCPYCQTGRMVYVIGFGRGGPPLEYLAKRGFDLTLLAK